MKKNKKHAYLIMAYKIDTLDILLKQLDYEFNDIFVHIDKKVKLDSFDYLYRAVNKSNLYICQKYRVSWGDISQTKCQLFLLSKAYKGGYSYYHLLSESDFPLKSNSDIYKFFEKENKNFVHFQSKSLPSDKYNWINRYYLLQKYNRHSKWLTKIENISIFIQKLLNINRCKKGEKYACGANWFSIKNDLANYVIENKSYILKRYSYTRSSDEIYLQTLIVNSEYSDTLYDKKYDNDYSACQRYIDWNRGNPYIFSNKDVNELLSKNDFCFVRKVNLNDDTREIISKNIKERKEINNE